MSHWAAVRDTLHRFNRAGKRSRWVEEGERKGREEGRGKGEEEREAAFARGRPGREGKRE